VPRSRYLGAGTSGLAVLGPQALEAGDRQLHRGLGVDRRGVVERHRAVPGADQQHDLGATQDDSLGSALGQAGDHLAVRLPARGLGGEGTIRQSAVLPPITAARLPATWGTTRSRPAGTPGMRQAPR
jgi:hypothetical protein